MKDETQLSFEFSGGPPATRYHQNLELFLHYERDFPNVSLAFERKALELFRAGRTNYGARCIIEVIRYEMNVARPASEKEFRINNNFTPFFARRFIQDHPEMDGFFSLREMVSLSTVPRLKPGEDGPRDFQPEKNPPRLPPRLPPKEDKGVIA